MANFCCTSAMKMCTLHNILKVRYFRKKNSSNVKNHICKLFFFLMMEASDWLCSAKHKVNQSEVMMDQVRINWVLKVVSWIRPFLSFLMTFKSEECLGTVIKWKINNYYKMNNCLAQSVFMFNPFFTLILIIRNLVHQK